MKTTLISLLPLAAVVAATGDGWWPAINEDCDETTSTELPVPTVPVLPVISGSESESATAALSLGQKWTTSIVYATQFHTITSCGPEVTNCPAHSTVATTIIVPVSTTICPVTEAEGSASAIVPPAKPTKSIVSPVFPAASTSIVLPVGTGPTKGFPSPSPVGGSIYVNPASSMKPVPTLAPSATFKSITANGAIGTVTAPAKTSSTHAVVTAGAAQNIQRAGGALAAAALAAALL